LSLSVDEKGFALGCELGRGGSGVEQRIAQLRLERPDGGDNARARNTKRACGVREVQFSRCSDELFEQGVIH